MKHIFFGYLITVLVLSACSSGKSTFERGNYYEAVITSVNRLRRNSDHKKSIENLRQAYPFAVTFYIDRAKTSLASDNEFKWSAVVDSYTAINTMYDEIKRCPGALRVIPEPVNYFSQLQEAKANAAGENYDAGLLALEAGSREKAKEAYGFFKAALHFVADYKDATKMMETALWAATIKVMVEPIPVHSKSVGVSAEFFNDKISEYVHSAPVNEFVRFFTRQEIQKTRIKPDHIIQLEFDDFTVGQLYRHEKETQLTKDSVEVGSYVSASESTQNSYVSTTNSGGRTLVASHGNGGVSIQSSNSKTTADNAAEQKALADKALADKLRAEQESARIKAEQELARIKAEEELARLRAEQLKAEKLKADQALADKALADKSRAEQESARIKAEQELARIKAEEELARLRAEQLKAEKLKADQALADKLKAEQEIAEKEKADMEVAAKLKADKEKADKELADKLKADKERADKELADKLKADKEKADKLKNADPTILASDTTDVKDPVTVCHMPPGNKANHRTLKISRAALKAHLGHGDVEGGCDDGQQPKGKPQENEGNKKTPPGQEKKKDGKVSLFDNEPVFIASADPDIQRYLRYFSETLPVAEADTNKVYATVKATLYEYQKTITSKGIVSFKIIDAKTGALLSVEKMPGEFVWASRWATFNGDERALSAEQLKLTQQKEQAPPAPQDLFIEFTRPIFDQLTSKIQHFYKQY